jgi:hypothetical protein
MTPSLILIYVISNAKNKVKTYGQPARRGVRKMVAPDPSTRTAQAIERLARSASLGPPPLIEGEDGTAYNQLYRSMTVAVKPKDFLEEIWVRDIVDLSWDVLRLRRLKAQLLTYGTAAQVINQYISR